MYVIVYQMDGVIRYGERFKSQREAEWVLQTYVQPAWIEVLVR